MEELSKDELWAIYHELPDALKDAIFSEDTADVIWNICKLHDVENVSEVAKLVGRALMGLMPPELFQETLKDELKLDQDTAQKTAMEIEHFIFNPVKTELDALYQEEGEDKEKPKEKEPEESEKPDVYREPIG